MKRSRRRTAIWIVSIMAVALAGIIAPILAIGDSERVTFTATLYSDIIRFEAAGVASLRVTIYDLSENELWSSGQVMGDFVDWDRTNAYDEQLANGYYLYLAQGWDATEQLLLNRLGKVVLLPGDRVELKAAPSGSFPLSAKEDDSMDSVAMEPRGEGTLSDIGIFGQIGVGTTSPNYSVHLTGAGAQLVVDSDTIVSRYRRYTDGGNGPATIYAKARGTIASPSSAQGGDSLGGFIFMGYDGSGWRYGAALRAFVDGVTGSSDMPGSLYFETSPDGSASLETRMVINNVGNVGIGATSVTDKLTIQGASGNLIACYPDGSRTAGAAVFRVESDGDVYADGTVYSARTDTGGADVAERINVSEWVESGDVVEIDPEHIGFFRKAERAYSRRVAGIISTSPGVILGNDVDLSSDEWNDNRPVLAIAGRVLVKASVENGPIAIGDLLVSSSTPGVAMKGDPSASIGAVVGKAMEALEDAEGVIMAQVTLR